MDSEEIHWDLGAQTIDSGGGVPVPSFTATWNRLAVVVSSTGGAV